MLKEKIVKEIKRTLRQQAKYIKQDFESYESHKNIAQLVANIEGSLQVTLRSNKDSLELYNL